MTMRAGVSISLLVCSAVTVAWLSGSPAEARFTEDHSADQGKQGAEIAAGREAIRAEDWFLAVRQFRAAVARSPGDPDAWSLLGFSLRKSGEVEPALSAYTRALSLDPLHRDALAYLGRAYLQLGMTEEAKALLPRLEAACASAETAGVENPESRCEGHDDLVAAIAAFEAGTPISDEVDGSGSGW